MGWTWLPRIEKGGDMQSSIDYMEESLLALFDQYKEMYSPLEARYKGEACFAEYGRGGTILHRGFYCPSPIIDIVIGGSDRGRLIKNTKNMTSYDYVFHRTKDGRLIIVDQYWFEREGYNPYRREFLIERENQIIAPIFEKTCANHQLVYLSLCEYDTLGRIVSYRTMLPGYRMVRNIAEFEIQKCSYYAEDYTYAKETGWIASVHNGKMMDGLASETSYCFYHDDDGTLTAFQSTCSELNNKIYTVPKSKQRKV